MKQKTPSRTNRDILTGGSKYRNKQAKKHGVEEVVFDKDSRHEFLTGFHKRKVERQKKAKKFHEEQDRLARIEERKQVREEKQKEFAAKLEELQAAKALDVDTILKNEEDDEWDGFTEEKSGDDDKKSLSGSESDYEPLKGILQKKQVYKIDNPDALGDAVVDEETTVTVESLENPNFAKVGQSSLDVIAKSNNVNLQKSEEVLEKSIERAKKYAVVCGVSKPQPKQKKKKFRYLTKTERRENNRKAKLSKLKSRKRD